MCSTHTVGASTSVGNQGVSTRSGAQDRCAERGIANSCATARRSSGETPTRVGVPRSTPAPRHRPISSWPTPRAARARGERSISSPWSTHRPSRRAAGCPCSGSSAPGRGVKVHRPGWRRGPVEGGDGGVPVALAIGAPSLVEGGERVVRVGKALVRVVIEAVDPPTASPFPRMRMRSISRSRLGVLGAGVTPSLSKIPVP